MNYALQISAQGVLTSLYRSDVLSNNMANFDTDGFKPDVAVVRQRDVARVEDGLGHLPSNLLLEALGAGPHMAPNRIDFGQGPIDTTTGEFDMAIKGDGFFLIATGAGDVERLRLTRDGRLGLDDGGRLVQSSTGHRVLDSRERPIFIDRGAGPIDVDREGVIRQGDREVSRLAFVDLPDRSRLSREGDGLFVAPPEEQASFMRATGQIVQRAIEKSSVNEISMLKDLTDAFSGVGANIRMMTYADDMLDRAINRLGRVA